MHVYNFPNIGYILNTFTNKELQPIRDEIKEIQSTFDSAKKINHSEAGAIKKEFEIIKSKEPLEKLILPMKQAFDDCFDQPAHRPDGQAYIKQAWVNFQSAGEIYGAAYTYWRLRICIIYKYSFYFARRT